MNNTAIKINNVFASYGRTQAVSDISLEVKKGDFLGIIGPNGGGKSTLLKALLGLIPITSGEIKIFGESRMRNRRLIGYVPQFAVLDKSFPISVFEVVLTGRLKSGFCPFLRFTEQDKDFIREIIDLVGISELADRRISELSGGEFQKMLIARALATRPKLLLLDEPTASVDASSRDQIYGLLAELNKDMTIVLVTHDLLAVSSRVKSLACMNTRLVYHGEPELTESIANSLYGCPVDLIAHGVPHRVLKEHDECCGGDTNA